SDFLVKSFLIIIVEGLFLALISILLSASTVLHLIPAFVTTRCGANVLTAGSAFASSATPKLSNLIFHIQEFIIPGNNDSIPLYPLYDNNRDAIWTGDNKI